MAARKSPVKITRSFRSGYTQCECPAKRKRKRFVVEVDEPAGGRLRLAQHVAHTADGVNEARLAPRLHLSSEVADVDVERVRGPFEVEAPDLGEDHGPREHLPRMGQEELEHAELRLGELDAPFAPRD